jgi:hypothetical protein
MDEVTTFFVRRQGRVEGPWPIGKLRSEIALKKLGRHHELSSDGKAWRRAGDLEHLFLVVSAKKRASQPGAASPATGGQLSGYSDEVIDLTLEDVVPEVTVKAWYYNLHDQQLGPVTGDDIVRAVQDRRLPSNVPVWREGFSEWRPFEEVPELLCGDLYSRPSNLSGTESSRRTAITSLRSSYSGYAIWTGLASLCLSWVPLVGFAGLVPIVCGFLAIRDVNRSEGRLAGLGFGIAGIMLGIASIAIGAIELSVFGYVIWQNLNA